MGSNPVDDDGYGCGDGDDDDCDDDDDDNDDDDDDDEVHCIWHCCAKRGNYKYSVRLAKLASCVLSVNRCSFIREYFTYRISWPLL